MSIQNHKKLMTDNYVGKNTFNDYKGTRGNEKR